MLVLIIATLARCDSAPGVVQDPEEPPRFTELSFYPQRLVYALLPTDQVDGDSIHVPITIAAQLEADGGADEVWFAILAPSPLQDPLLSGRLTRTEFGRFEQQVTVTLSALEVQAYTILVYALDKSGQVTADARGTLHYFRSFEPGIPPAIDSLVVPDTLHRPGPGQPAASLVLIAKVRDADGQSDVALVEFWNESAPANRFLMCDDGGSAPCGASDDSGDETAGDSLFTRRVFITSDNAAGTTMLVFQATDRAGLLSKAHIRSVVIL